MNQDRQYAQMSVSGPEALPGSNAALRPCWGAFALTPVLAGLVFRVVVTLPSNCAPRSQLHLHQGTLHAVVVHTGIGPSNSCILNQ